jgi:hypothetical protein
MIISKNTNELERNEVECSDVTLVNTGKLLK